MKHISIILSFYLVCCTTVCAQELYTLEKCLEIGLERNFSIRIVKNEAQISANNATPGNAGYLPTVDLNGGVSGSQYSYNNDYSDGTSSKDKNINNETVNLGINLNWTVFDGFGIQADYSKLKELRQMGELNTRIAIENLTAGISAEYYNLIRQRIRQRNLNSAVLLSKERLRIVEAHFVIGSMSGLELQQAKVYFNADSSELIKQNEAVNTSLILLKEQMGLDNFNENVQLFDTIPINAFLVESDLWQKSIDNNALLLAFQKNKTLSELDFKKIQSRNYPYFRINAGYGYAANWYSSGTTELQQRLGLNYGLTMGMTLFNGMNRRREQSNARIQIQNSELRIQDFELGLRADFSKLWDAYRINLGLWELEKENLVVARNNYATAIDRYRLGNLAGIDLREAQNSLLGAEERLSIAEYNTKLCEISLMQLSGQILDYLAGKQ